MRRLLPILLLCAGASLSASASADNICLKSDPHLSFPGTNVPYVFGVTDDPTTGYGLSLCSPTTLDLSWLTSYGFGDFNHDGFEDLMLGRSSKSGGEVMLLYNDGTGSDTTVLSATLPTGTATAPVSVTALDLNGDGWDDVITANGTGGSFTVMLNDGSGAFPAVQQYAAGSDVSLLAAMDVNGDGHPDVVTVSTQDQTVSVFLNNGDGSFGTPSVYHVGGPVGSLSVADLNGDGYPDIYVTSVAEFNIFAPSAPPSSTPGGVQEFVNNGDGTFTASAWTPYGFTYGGSSGGVTLSVSGIGETVSASDIAALVGGGTASLAGSTASVTLSSGGTATLPAGSTSTTVTSSSGGVNQPSGSGKSSSGSKGGTATSSSTGSSGSGAMAWLSVLFLGVTRLLRRKRA